MSDIQVNSWVNEYVRGIFIIRGYDPSEEDTNKVFELQYDNWKRLMVKSGLNKDETLANEVAFEFSCKRLTGNVGKVFEQFAEFVNSRPRAVIANEVAHQHDFKQAGLEACDVCESFGMVSIPMMEDGNGGLFLADLEDAKRFVLRGLIRIETYDREPRIAMAMVHPILTEGGRAYFNTREQSPLKRLLAYDELRLHGQDREFSLISRYRIVNRSFKCECIKSMLYAALPPLTENARAYAMQRLREERARGEEWLDEKGIRGRNDEETRQRYTAWARTMKVGDAMFARADSPDEKAVKDRIDGNKARELTRAVREREVLVTDIPDGWEAVVYTGGVFFPMDEVDGFIQPNPSGRIQKKREIMA